MKLNRSNREVKIRDRMGLTMEINTESLDGALRVLSNLLADRGLHYEVVAIGGGGLLLLGLVDRTTKDLDLVALLHGKELISPNPLPTALLDFGLPLGFVNRLHCRRYGGLTLYLADRIDQIYFKLYASVDQGPQSKHFTDLNALNPSLAELRQAKNWCLTHDSSTEFEKEIDLAIESIHASN
jgi:hypothetical protein